MRYSGVARRLGAQEGPAEALRDCQSDLYELGDVNEATHGRIRA